MPTGNPMIIWNGNEIDLGSRKVDDLGTPGRHFEGTRRFGGAAETILSLLRDGLLIRKAPFTDQSLMQSLRTFGAWAQAGNPFAFALYSDARVDTVLDADPDWVEKISNGDFLTWDGSPLAPDGYTVATPNDSDVTRETLREDVFVGPFSCRLLYGSSTTDTPSIEITTASVPASEPVALTYWAKHLGAGAPGIWVKVQNDTTSNYLQDAGTWAAGSNEVSSDGADPGGGLTMGVAFGQASHGFTNDTSAGTLTITLRAKQDASNTGSEHWIDGLSLRSTGVTVPLRSTTDINTTDYYRLRSRTAHHEAVVSVASISAGVSVELDAQPPFTFADRDRFLSLDYYPDLHLDQDDPVLFDVRGGLYRLDMKCRQALTGRG